MNQYKLFGENAELSELARLVMDQDIDAIQKCIDSGLDVNAGFFVSGYVVETPLTVALVENKLEVVNFLLEHGANLNQKHSPSIVTAVRNCDAKTVKMLVARGAEITAENSLHTNAFSAALYSGRYDLLPVIAELGLKVDADGGVSFRQAVCGKQYAAIDFFISKGIDVNLRKPDQVFSENPTSVSVAASNDDFELVKLLVSHGADVTLKDKYGDRPYSHAVRNKNVEMQAFLKNLEPAQWHDEEQRIKELKGYSLPPGLLDFLRQNNRRLALEKSEFSDIEFIEFHSLLNVKEVKWNGRKFLDLLSEVDGFSADGFLVWSPKNKKLASADYEHDGFRVLCKWEEFRAEPIRWINTIFS